METLTSNKDCDQQLQTSFPTARRDQVPCAVLVTLADMSHLPEIHWGDFANTVADISAVAPLWGLKISTESSTDAPVDNILDMDISEEISSKSIDTSVGQPLMPLPSEAILSDNDVDMLDADYYNSNYGKALSNDTNVDEADSIADGDIRDRKFQVTAKRSVRGLRLMSAIGLGFNPLRYPSVGNACTVVKRVINPGSWMKIRRAIARFYRLSRDNVSTGFSGSDSRFGARSSRSQLSPLYGTDSLHTFGTITSRNFHCAWPAHTHLLPRHMMNEEDNNSKNTSMPGSYAAEDGGETPKNSRDSKLDSPSINSRNSDKTDTKVRCHYRSGEGSSYPAFQQRQDSNLLDYGMPHKFDVHVHDMSPEKFLEFIRQREPIVHYIEHGEPIVCNGAQSSRCSALWRRLGAAYGASLLTKNLPRIDNIAPGTNRPHYTENHQVERVALFIAGLAPESPLISDSILVAHTYGYHAHIKHSDHAHIDKSSVAEYIMGWAIESWSQGWPFVVVLDATSIFECEVKDLIKFLRISCDTETMDVVVYTTNKRTSEVSMLRAGASTVLKCPTHESLNFFFWQLRNRVPPLRINFYNKGAPYYEFTNFFEAKFIADNYEWKTTEHFFQANKFPNDHRIYHEVLSADNARTAFNLSRRHHAKRRADWESLDTRTGRTLKEEVMLVGLWNKFKCNPLLKHKLLSTGSAPIFEHTANDLFWGDGANGSGQNRLGVLLEATREMFFKEEIISLSVTEHLTETAKVRAQWYLNDLVKWGRS